MQLNVRPIAGIAMAALIALLPQAARSAPHDYRDPNFDYFVVGDPQQPRAAHTEFGLALMGGGGSVDAAFAFIARHGGGGHMVILRAVSDDSYDSDDGNYGHSFAKEWGPVVSAETIVFHHREAAFDPRVIAALGGADGIFLAGGDQSNYVRYWKGTPVQDLLNAHVRANRPIGGSSAGLAILGHYSYTALDGGSLESKAALMQPYDPSVTLENDFLHFRGLEQAVTDTHFSKRCRLGRLIVFLARTNQDHQSARAFGIGVDEKSALLIDGKGIGRMAEGSAGSVWVIVPPRPRPPIQAGKPLTLDDIRIVRMDANSTLDLHSQRVGRPAADMTDSVKDGVPAGKSIASSLMLRDVVPPNES